MLASSRLSPSKTRRMRTRFRGDLVLILITVFLALSVLFRARNFDPPAINPFAASGAAVKLSLEEHKAGTDLSSQNPCSGRPTPAVLPASSRPPSLYFLHIPKTAGTLMYHLVMQFANRTNGLACQFLYDGNRFGTEAFQMSIIPPPVFAEGTIERQAVDAFRARRLIDKKDLYEKGACRTVRGHVTYMQRDAIKAPVISLTVVRHPIERFLSMYHFAMMMVRSRPNQSGWDNLITGNLENDYANASSLVHKGFYDTQGNWLARDNVGFSFHFYGVLHQLSGITPVFGGVGDPETFHIANAEELVEKSKDNICGTHILGSQSDVKASLDLFFKFLEPYATWSDLEKKRAKSISINKNHFKKGSVDDLIPSSIKPQIERRFQHEMKVYLFAQKVIEYRKRTAAAT